MLEKDKNKKREDRHKITQEDFTPPNIVKVLCDNISEDEYKDHESTFMDNSCGIGNILIEVLKRKLSYCSTIDDAIVSLKSIYGVDIMADNVEECRNNLYETIINVFPEITKDFNINFKVRAIIRNRIQWYDSLTFDYNHWPALSTTPRSKHMNVSFSEVKRDEDTQFPMWFKDYSVYEQSLF